MAAALHLYGNSVFHTWEAFAENRRSFDSSELHHRKCKNKKKLQISMDHRYSPTSCCLHGQRVNQSNTAAAQYGKINKASACAHTRTHKHNWGCEGDTSISADTESWTKSCFLSVQLIFLDMMLCRVFIKDIFSYWNTFQAQECDVTHEDSHTCVSFGCSRIPAACTSYIRS